MGWYLPKRIKYVIYVGKWFQPFGICVPQIENDQKNQTFWRPS